MVTLARLASALALLFLASCGSLSSDSTAETTQAATSYIYVASGTTYAGNAVTMATPSNVVSKFDTDGNFVALIQDYALSPGDTPVGLANYDSEYLLVLVENTSGRRIEKLAKDGSSAVNFIVNSTALNGVLRSIVATPDGGWLVSKSTAIEKFSSAKARVTAGASPYVNAPGGACATSATLTTSIRLGPSDNILMAHAAASPNNQVNLIKSTGYTAAADCLASIDGPTANHWPTALNYHSSGKLFVGYGNNTGPTHQIYSYDVSTTAFSNATQAFNDIAIVQGISAMAEHPDGSLLVATAASTFNTIEKLTYSSSTGLLTRDGTTSFIPASIYTKSVSSILIAD